MLFSSNLGLLLFALQLLTEAWAFPPDPQFFGIPGVNRTFDYVVVGGGNAGLTIASRLASSGFDVAVVEAGGLYQTENGNLSIVPGLATSYTGSAPNNSQPLVDWGFTTPPQPGTNNRLMHYARGKTLGGSTARNYMLYHRPTNQSMQRWADQVDDVNWTFDNLLQWYKKSCTFHKQGQATMSNATNNQSAAGFDEQIQGPVQVSYPNYIDAFSTWAREAFNHSGMQSIDGFNAGKLIGSAWVTWSIDPRNAYRSSSTSYVNQVSSQSRLTIYINSLVQKILFDTGNNATGVLVATQGTFGTPSVSFVLQASNEVIVSAGAFQSPQLLMVSGIGPPNILAAQGIKVIKAAPGVGQNMQDHPFWGTSYRVNLTTASAPQNNPQLMYADNAAWLQNASGPLSTFSSSYFGWEKLPSSNLANISKSTLDQLNSYPSDWPMVEFLPVNGYLGYQRNYQTEDPRDGTNYATIATALLMPQSVGNVSIRSANMADPPLINSNILLDTRDTELAVAIFNRTRAIWSYLSSRGVTVGDEALPGPAVKSPADILAFIRQSVIPLYHASCTCKMGRANDSMAVVNSEGHVYGVNRLRVVDASIFPFLPPGHPQSTVYMLAEKIAADIILSNSSLPVPTITFPLRIPTSSPAATSKTHSATTTISSK